MTNETRQREPIPPAKLREMYGDDPERILGRRLRALREEAGMTQTQLADAMTRQGFPMHQTMIGKVEANQRPVRVNEAAALAGILGFALPDLLADPDLNAETSALRDELRQATARRLDAEARYAQLKAALAEVTVSLSAATEERNRADEAEREARRLYRLARRRSAGHSPAEDEADG
jgi:transcriptional regulator with XRE-family HTH domain